MKKTYNKSQFDWDENKCGSAFAADLGGSRNPIMQYSGGYPPGIIVESLTDVVFYRLIHTEYTEDGLAYWDLAADCNPNWKIRIYND